MTIGSRVRALRTAKGMKQGELAKAIGIKQPSLNQIEKNVTKSVKASTLMRLAKVLDANAHWLETGQGSPTAPIEAKPADSEVLAIWQKLTPTNKAAWIASGRAMLEQQDDAPSPTRPFVGSKTHKVRQ
jgi:HTH-type transcriptional regulator, cell division transcriptional repressor